MNRSKESRKIAEISKHNASAVLEAGYIGERLALVNGLLPRLGPQSESIVGAEFSRALDQSVAYLQSQEAAEALALDPYWPKWQGPWWHALLLFELGQAGKIPHQFWQKYVSLVDSHYLHFFPFRMEEVPEHLDPVSNIACHCFLGTYVQVLSSIEGNNHISPWIAGWFQRYQNPDGGLNCDEAAYLKDSPTSSVTSTVPVVEALLSKSGNLSRSEEDFVDRSMDYVLKRRLLRSLSSGKIIDESWLAPAFPRYYEYDVMRGLQLTAKYAVTMGRKVQACQILEAFQIVDGCLGVGGFTQKSSHCLEARTRVPVRPGLPLLTGQSAICPPLLRFCDQPGTVSPWLLRHYAEILTNIGDMLNSGLIILS